MLALGVGFWILLLAEPHHVYALIVAAIFIAGFGNGLSYLAGLNIVNTIAPPEHRAETLSAFLVVCYLGSAFQRWPSASPPTMSAFTPISPVGNSAWRSRRCHDSYRRRSAI